ncbi:hypothetical protein C5167_031152 [Papaver somniferum]|nr:hypothetical protein C5167_031152 [Papaver somniferum]
MILTKLQLEFRFTIRIKSFYASLSFPSLSAARNLWKKISKQTDLSPESLRKALREISSMYAKQETFSRFTEMEPATVEKCCGFSKQWFDTWLAGRWIA